MAVELKLQRGLYLAVPLDDMVPVRKLLPDILVGSFAVLTGALGKVLWGHLQRFLVAALVPFQVGDERGRRFTLLQCAQDGS